MNKEISCINTRAVLDYIKENYSDDYSGVIKNLNSELDALPDPERFLTDPNNWIPCTVAVKIYERARLLLGDNLAAYKIAKYAVEKAKLGYAQRIIVMAFGSPAKALKHAQKINDKWNRNKKVEIVELKKSRAVLRLHWDRNMYVSKDLCLMNQGTYAYIPIIWGGKPLSLEEKCCYFEGAHYCEYHLKWSPKNWLYENFSKIFRAKSVLKETIKEMEEDKKLIEDKYEEVNRLNLELNYKIKQLTAIHETGKAILSVLDLNQLLTVIMNILSNVCQINRAVIMLVNENEWHLEYIHGRGFNGNVPEEIKNYKISLDRLSNILVRVTNTGRPEYVPEVKSSNLRKENIILTYGNPSSVFVVPLITRSKVIGVIATDGVDDKGIPKETRETLEVFSPQIAIAVENARLYSKLEKQMRELKESHSLLSRSEKFSFLGNLAARLAHEIKNPMTAIGTFIQMIPQKYHDAEFREKFHSIAMEETTRINNLINELLNLVKKRESNFELSNLHDLIDKMILLVSPQSNAKKIKVTRRFDPDIGQAWMDGDKIKEVILNLLSNAVEFTPEGGKIEIFTKSSDETEKPAAIHIEIKDNGSGISQSMIDNVFDPYFTTKHKSSMHNGTGLGLFIAHQNMQDHHGSIEVRSKVNEGSVFKVTLPIHKTNSR
jgi:signal transduction histidine kinase